MPVKTVLCFGSGGIEGDDAAFDVCRELVGHSDDVQFVMCDTPMDILGYAGRDSKDIYILDAVKGLNSVSFFESVDVFRRNRSVTAHDQDLGMMLKVLIEMKMLPDVRIIGIPMGSNASEAAKEVSRLLSLSGSPRP
ncbi:MAG: hypothetical protein JXC85_01985 [Candidatus Aenigmarchaeota archaeon]|nr:hypothetical protein [Candidatus Aenigmarchaeota archaeon]